MPVWEIKEPLGIRPNPIKSLKKEVAPAVSARGVRAIDRLLLNREWGKGKRQSSHEPSSKSPASIRKVRLLVEQVNSNLEVCGIMIHLVLAMKNDMWGLDVYDCSVGDECRIIYNIPVDSLELSSLLASLQRETGIMLDRVL